MPEVSKPKYQIMPPLSDEDREALAISMREQGFLEEFPIVMDDAGEILDGHTRFDVARELGITTVVVTKYLMTEERKLEYVWRVNISRRHLTTAQKHELIQKRLVLTKGAVSNRSIAKDVGVSHTTVGATRQKLEETGQIDQFTAKGGRGIHAGTPAPATSAPRKITTSSFQSLQGLAENHPDKYAPTLAKIMDATPPGGVISKALVRRTVGDAYTEDPDSPYCQMPEMGALMVSLSRLGIEMEETAPLFKAVPGIEMNLKFSEFDLCRNAVHNVRSGITALKKYIDLGYSRRDLGRWAQDEEEEKSNG